MVQMSDVWFELHILKNMQYRTLENIPNPCSYHSCGTHVKFPIRSYEPQIKIMIVAETRWD